MDLKLRIMKIINKVEDLFLSNHACLVCRREIPDGASYSMCLKCLDKLTKIEGKVCEKCGEMVEGEARLCDRCKDNNYRFDRSQSFAYYDDVSSKIIKRFKYLSKKYYARHIAELMMKNEKIFEGIDYLTFVPIGNKRRKERGFNQAEEIANELSKLSNIPVIEVLRKVGDERHQAGLSQGERLINLQGSFAVVEDNLKLIKGKRLIIIDDVFTTGSTLSECSREIKRHKDCLPKSVCCYTFAKTKLFSTRNG